MRMVATFPILDILFGYLIIRDVGGRVQREFAFSICGSWSGADRLVGSLTFTARTFRAWPATTMVTDTGTTSVPV